LGQYVVLVSVICLIGALPAVLLGLFSGPRPARTAAAFLPSQLMALSTQSSLATLPVMLRGAEGLGVPERIRALVLPIAVALFRATNPAANMAIVLYIANVYGVGVPLPRLLISIGLAALMSLAGVGVASSVAFATVLIPLCIALNLPIAILPLLLSVEPILDFSRTLGNVTADLAVTVWARRWARGGEGKK
jgi:Na+/H+-dicarboxylate symporter